MIPRIKTGKSFKGAELYYLHDKSPNAGPKATTRERVAWTHTLNCVHDDPELALAEMRHTAFDQPYLKMVSGNRVDGRPTEKPVMTVALAWPPDQHPSRPEMIDAAQGFLTHMGWQEHQVVMVAHNDTRHPHVHLIINKVHHETGMTLDEAWSQKRSQEWGLKFEREQGQIYCLKRLDNQREQHRGRGKEQAFAHYGDWRTANQEMNREGLFAPENNELATSAEWVSLKKEQRDERTAFWKKNSELFKHLRKEAYAEVKEEFAAQWHDYEKTAAATTLAIKERQSETNRLCKYYTRQMRTMTGGPVNSSHIEGVKKARAAQDAYAKEMRAALKQQRDDIKTVMRERFEQLSGEALTHLKDDRAKAYQHLLARQRDDKRELRQDQAQARRRYDLLAHYGRSRANDNQPGKTPARQAANSNRPPHIRTAEIVHDLSPACQRTRQEVQTYIRRVRAEQRMPEAGPPHEKTDGMSLAEQLKRAGYEVGQRSTGDAREAGHERGLEHRGEAQERHERSGSERHDRDTAAAVPHDREGIPFAEQMRRAALETERERHREKDDRQVLRDGHRDSRSSGRDRGGGRER
ncbi:relaxase/mobilization nuclease domain-containing protein [Rhodomicrobium vannielii ATCC 17100]|uniref:relaxase/mobilization nuclease domain-containing protein n=1 Tax=Rhodomicrobium vannielii TaxID=1069 RepID=UPI001919041B|nr:relaxase/mobilization nuclease domain-containing protein [Rhodomicrobium vannielii]MBJ7532938.1 relaxase/mobilization nuclease domain-containing protein [Rhodomicrobium vannielii ATCC 17100]